MARKKIENALSLNATHMQQINAAVTDMLTVHNEEITAVVEESDDRCVTVNFAVKLDCSETVPTIDVGCRFSSAITDKRTIRCDDPKQPDLFTMLTPAELKAHDADVTRKAKAGKSKGVDEEDEE